MEPITGETTLERAMIRRAAEAKTPINGSLELLPLCNMNCDMCYVRLSRSEMERQGRLRTPGEWLALGEQMQKAGVLFLLLTGGEPLLYPGFQEVYLGLKRMGFVLTLNTNGTLMDEQWAAFFGRHKPRRVNITLYGADDRAYTELCHYPGGFDRTVEGIRLLREQGVDVKVGGSLTGHNEADLPRLLDIGEELGVPVRVDTYMMPAARERERDFDPQARLEPERAAQARIYTLRREMGEERFRAYVHAMLEQVEHPHEAPGEPTPMSCLAGSCSFTVNWQGEMRPCVVLSGPSVPVFDLGFQKAWAQLRRETAGIRTSPVCSACALWPLCRTCAAAGLLETGRYDGVPDYLCRYTRRSLELLRQWAKEQGGGENK